MNLFSIKRIFKYRLDLKFGGQEIVSHQKIVKVLHSEITLPEAEHLDPYISVWAEVYTQEELPETDRTLFSEFFYIVPTGEKVLSWTQHVGTHIRNGIVVHIYRSAV